MSPSCGDRTGRLLYLAKRSLYYYIDDVSGIFKGLCYGTSCITILGKGACATVPLASG